MLDDPARVDAHVVGDHVAGEANATLLRAIAEIVVCGLTAEVLSDVVVEQRVGAGDSVCIAHQLLNLLRSTGAFPEPNEPKGIEAPPGEGVEFSVRNLVEPMDVALVLLG